MPSVTGRAFFLALPRASVRFGIMEPVHPEGAIAAITDGVDGYRAHRNKEVTLPPLRFRLRQPLRKRRQVQAGRCT